MDHPFDLHLAVCSRPLPCYLRRGKQPTVRLVHPLNAPGV